MLTSPDQLGIFARTFPRPDAALVAEAVAAAGFRCVQLNLNSFGCPTIPVDQWLTDLDPQAIRHVFEAAGISVWGVSLTYNMIDPDENRRKQNTRAAREFLARIPELGAGYATVCTGTRDGRNMWQGHPDNASDSAWRDLATTLAELLPAVRESGLRLAVEPEGANVISDAAAARRLLDQLGPESDLIGIVLDPANLVTVESAPRQEQILTEAFELLADDIVCLHAKDVVAGEYAAAGLGLLDYDLILRLRAGLPRPVPVIVQDSTESDSIRVREMITGLLKRHPAAGDSQP